jgi:ADP-heptose:LPS heptosyltransferase
MMHIASAFKKPIISFWGATVPDFGMYPYLNENLDERIAADHLGKRPCSKLGTKCKYKECLCIDELPISKAVDIANYQIGLLTP